MSKSRKELKENELAGAITDQFDSVKPHLPKILIGIALIVAVVFGVNYLISSRSSAKESKAIHLVLFGVENSAAGSLATLDQQIEDFPEEATTAWAYLMKGDRELTSGLEKIFVDKPAGRDFIQRSVKNFEMALELAGDNEMVKTRALFGWARAFESLGNFDDAAAKFAEIVKLGETPFKALAEKGIARVNNADNQEFYILFEERGDDSLTEKSTTTGDNTAPPTNSGLKSRPDFTYPGEELDVAGPKDDDAAPGDNDVAPGTNPKSEDQKDKKKDNAPPMPSDDVVGKKSESGKNETPAKKDESGKSAPEKKEAPKAESKTEKSEPDKAKAKAEEKKPDSKEKSGEKKSGSPKAPGQ